MTRVFADEFELTAREMRVVASIARGRGARGAARELGLSYHTVQQHLKTIFSKTDTTRQTALIVLFLTHPTAIRDDR